VLCNMVTGGQQEGGGDGSVLGALLDCALGVPKLAGTMCAVKAQWKLNSAIVCG
jgi:hypothetical protein